MAIEKNMRRPRISWAFFLWGLLCFTCLPLIYLFQKNLYARSEHFFQCPVPCVNNVAPLRNDIYGKGYFGASRNGGRTHQGIDILGKVGDPVLASKSGRVLRAENHPKGYGHLIEILHPDGLTTLYAHLSKIKIKSHDWVSQGSLIGNTGKTGNASNPKMMPHIHFEVRSSDKSIDPKSLISFKLQ